MSAPGWYSDPSGKPQQRYWDGATWTEHVQPYSAPHEPSTQQDTRELPNLSKSYPPVPHSDQPARTSWYRRKAIVIPLVVLALLIVVVTIAGLVSPAKTESASNDIPIVAATTSQAPTTAPRSSSASRTSAPKPKISTSTTSAKAVAPSTQTDDGSFAMPNETGKGLQAAQDDIQRVSGDPVFVSHSHDLLRSRLQIFDRDWKVCTQNVAPGAKASAIEHIDFGVVKLGESCP